MENDNESRNSLDPSTWVDRYSDELYKFTCLRINNDDDVKDLLQETFLAALRNINSYRGEISEKNWLYLILKNKIIDFYRKKAKSLKVEIPAMIEKEYDEYFDEAGHWKKGAYPQELSVSIKSSDEIELRNLIEKCMQKLNELQRMVFALKYIDEKDAPEICKELEITSSNYWVIVHRAKLSLRQCIEKNWKRHE